MPRRRNREIEPYPTIAQARAAVGPGNPFAAFESPLSTVLEDPEGVAALVSEEGQSWIDAAVMLDRIGFQLWLEGMVVDDGQTYGRWKVRVPDYIADEVALVIWQWKPSESRPRTLDEISFMLHKSTRHDGWQLTSFSADNQPWGHSEIYAFDDAFKTGPMDSGQSAGNVVQVVMKDGTVHTLPGRAPLVANPGKRRRRRRFAASVTCGSLGGMPRLSPKLQRWADEMAQAATSSPRENPGDTPYQKFLERRMSRGESLDEALQAATRHFGDETRRVYFFLGSRTERSAFTKLARELIRSGLAIDYDYYSKAQVIGEGAHPDFARARGEIVMADSQTPIPQELLDRMADEADLYFVDFYDDDLKIPR